MPVNPLDAGTPSLAARETPSAGGQRRRLADSAPIIAPDTDSAGAAPSNLGTLADTLGVDPAGLLAHLTAATAGATAPPAPTPDESAAAAAAALLNRDSPANAWTSDLTRHRGGLLVDVNA